MVKKKEAVEAPAAQSAEELLSSILATDTDGVNLLDSMLDQAMDYDVAAESGIGVDGAGISLPFVAIPQAKSTNYAVQEDEDSPPSIQAGKIFVGSREDQSTPEAYYKSGTFRMVLIDTIMHRAGKLRRGGRLMWPVKADGQRDMSGGVACASRNGVAPVPIYLGKEVYHPALGTRLRIGMTFNALGQEVPVLDGNVCDACPFSKWGLTKDEQGQDSAALCKRNTRFIVYDLAGERLAQFSGGNVGVEHALRGRRPNQNGNQKDGTVLEGIEKAYLRSGERHLVVPRDRVDSLRMNQWLGFGMYDATLGVVGLARDLADPENYVKMRAYEVKPGEEPKKNERFFAAYNNNLEEILGVILSVPIFPTAPNGKPEHVGEMTLVYPVRVLVVENDFKLDGAPNPTLVPKFLVDTEHPLTALQYAGILAAQQEYYKKEAETNLSMRDIFLGMDDIEIAKQRIGATQVLVSGAAPGGYLPPVAAANQEEFEKFTAPSDDILDE